MRIQGRTLEIIEYSCGMLYRHHDLASGLFQHIHPGRRTLSTASKNDGKIQDIFRRVQVFCNVKRLYLKGHFLFRHLFFEYGFNRLDIFVLGGPVATGPINAPSFEVFLIKSLWPVFVKKVVRSNRRLQQKIFSKIS